MYLLSVFMYSQQQFGLCDVHFLKLCERVQLSGNKLVILSIWDNQLWEARLSHASLVQFVWNHQEWFSTKMMFETEQTVASWARALVFHCCPVLHNVLETDPRTLLPTIALVIVLARLLIQRHRIFYRVLEMHSINLLM